MRPRSMSYFEVVVLLIVALYAGACAMAWDQLHAQLARQGIGSGALFGLLAGFILVILVLALIASRARSNGARWLYAILTALIVAAAAPSLPQVLRADPLTIAVNAAYLLLSLASLWLLFRADSRAWFAGPPPR